MPLVTFEKENKRLVCNSGINLRRLAKEAGIAIYSGLNSLINCRGHGLCGTCEVELVTAQQLHPRTRMEEQKLRNKPLERRLACQLVVHGDMTVRTHPPKWTPLDSKSPESSDR